MVHSYKILMTHMNVPHLYRARKEKAHKIESQPYESKPHFRMNMHQLYEDFIIYLFFAKKSLSKEIKKKKTVSYNSPTFVWRFCLTHMSETHSYELFLKKNIAKNSYNFDTTE